MRISTSLIFESGTQSIQRNQSDLFTLQNQLSTGRRILAPQDDPIGAWQALVVTQSKDVNQQYLDNQAQAQTQLSLVDEKLGSLNDELKNIYDRTIQAGNGSLDPEQKGMIAEELKKRLENILSLANSQDSNGLYIFAGFQSAVQPFRVTGAGGNYQIAPPANPYVSYAGDDGQQALQVSSSQSMPVSESGLDTFMQVRDGQGNLTGRSIFDSLQNLIDILDPASGIPFTQAAYDQALGDVQASVDHVSNQRASVGARLQALDSLTSSGQNVGLVYTQQLSQLQDLDYAQAISQLSQKQMQLEAAQISFKQVSQLTLFSQL